MNALRTIKSNLLSKDWWVSALRRAGRTAAYVALPYFVSATVFVDVPYISIASAAGLGFLASLITNVVQELPEVAGVGEPWWYSALSRVTKTFLQSLSAGIGSAVFFFDVEWTSILQLSAFAAVTSLLGAVVGTLPEANNPVAQATVPATVVNIDSGETVSAEAPAVIPVSSAEAASAVDEAGLRLPDGAE